MSVIQEIYEKTDFTLEVSSSGHTVMLRPVLLADCLQERTLVASFLIDGIEMIESARIVLSPDKKFHPFPNHALIHHPVLYKGQEDPDCASYTFTVLFYQAGAVCCRLEKKALLPAEKFNSLPEGETCFPVFTS